MSVSSIIESALNSGRRATIVISGIVLLGLVLALTAGPAGASSYPHVLRVSGMYVADPSTLGGGCEPVNADGTVLRCRWSGFVSAYTGDMEGTSAADFVQTINCQTGRTWGHGTETFTGSVAGGPQGSLTWRIAFSAGFDCELFYPFEFRGVGVITSGSDGLAGTYGVLRFGDFDFRGVLVG